MLTYLSITIPDFWRSLAWPNQLWVHLPNPPKGAFAEPPQIPLFKVTSCQDNVLSELCFVGIMSWRGCVLSELCSVGIMPFRADALSEWCPFGIMSCRYYAMSWICLGLSIVNRTLRIFRKMVLACKKSVIFSTLSNTSHNLQ